VSPTDLNTSGSNFTCWFVNRMSSVGTGPSGRLVYVLISSVHVDLPFKLLAEPKVNLYGCLDCQVFGLEIGSPPVGGNYSLSGTVYFVVGPWN
jgi:hypothetical protein